MKVGMREEIDTMKINAQKDKSGVQVIGELELERSWWQEDQQGMWTSLLDKALLGVPKRDLLLQLCSSGQAHSQERDSNA